MRTGQTPRVAHSSAPPKAQTLPIPPLSLGPSRRDLKRAGSKGAPERVDKAGIQQIGTVTQSLRQFRLVPVSGTASLGAQLNRLGHNGPRLKSIGDRVAPSHSAMTGGSGKCQLASNRDPLSAVQ